MALYTVRNVVAPDKRGVERERLELFRGEEYVTGVDVPKVTNMDWYRIAALRVRANLLNRHDDAEPKFGAPADDRHALTFAEMLNA